MSTLFTGVEAVLIAAAVSFVLGVLFSTKIKDWFKGVPTSLRADLKGVEGDIVGKVRAAQTAVVSQVKVNVKAPVAVPIGQLLGLHKPGEVPAAPAPVALAPGAPIVTLAPSPAPVAPAAPGA